MWYLSSKFLHVMIIEYIEGIFFFMLKETSVEKTGLKSDKFLGYTNWMPCESSSNSILLYKKGKWSPVSEELDGTQ